MYVSDLVYVSLNFFFFWAAGCRMSLLFRPWLKIIQEKEIESMSTREYFIARYRLLSFLLRRYRGSLSRVWRTGRVYCNWTSTKTYYVKPRIPSSSWRWSMWEIGTVRNPVFSVYRVAANAYRRRALKFARGGRGAFERKGGGAALSLLTLRSGWQAS